MQLKEITKIYLSLQNKYDTYLLASLPFLLFHVAAHAHRSLSAAAFRSINAASTFSAAATSDG
jgi:hypothetical protein